MYRIALARRFLWALLIGLTLPIFAPAALAQTAGEPEATVADAPSQAARPTSENGAPAGEPAREAPFDPAVVGLADWPTGPRTPEAFDRALELVDRRIAELGAADPPSATASEAAADPRIEALQALRLAVQREAALLGQAQALAGADAELQAQRTAFEEQGLEAEPPYPITLLDRLQAERRLSAQTVSAAERALSTAHRRAEVAAKELALAERERRQARERAQQAEPDGAHPELARQLEAARLAALAAQHSHQAAVGQLALAEQEKALAKERLALDAARIGRVRGQTHFPPEALAERLANLTEREQTIQQRIAALSRTADAAEGALFEAQQRLERAAGAAVSPVLEEQVAAREAELNGARKGIEYLRQAAERLATGRTLWERRYALMRDADDADLADWLSETRDMLAGLADEEDYLEAEIASLRSMQLAIARRLGEADVAAGVRRALEKRHLALEGQEGRAEELRVVQEEVAALGQRLAEELEPRVRQRTPAQHLEEAGERLRGWWNDELFVFQDQAFRVRDIATGVGVFALVMVAVASLKAVLRRTLLPRLVGGLGEEGRTSRALVLALLRNTNLAFVAIVAFYAAMVTSGLAQGQIKAWLWTLLIVALWLQIGIWATGAAVDLLTLRRSRKELRDPSAVSGYGLILFFVRVGIWIVVAVSVLAHFDYPITGVVGALGVGGIAVAFAMQNILSDIFNSMAIILDKPFRVGDFIITGDTLGVVEHIGVKTTQIRSLSGEQVILSNTDLLGSRIHNYKRMRERRVVFRLGVVYQTPPEKLERIPRIIEDIVRSQGQARFDRAHFFEYGDFALIFEIVYYVLSADYSLYMDTQQAINLAIYRRFQEAGIEFAYPTQELIVRRPPAGSESPATERS